jgi:hypothetical protein
MSHLRRIFLPGAPPRGGAVGRGRQCRGQAAGLRGGRPRERRWRLGPRAARARAAHRAQQRWPGELGERRARCGSLAASAQLRAPAEPCAAKLRAALRSAAPVVALHRTAGLGAAEGSGGLRSSKQATVQRSRHAAGRPASPAPSPLHATERSPTSRSRRAVVALVPSCLQAALGSLLASLPTLEHLSLPHVPLSRNVVLGEAPLLAALTWHATGGAGYYSSTRADAGRRRCGRERGGSQPGCGRRSQLVSYGTYRGPLWWTGVARLYAGA